DGSRVPSPPMLPSGNDLAEIVYTSGTTGTPKGVLLTHANIISNVMAVRAAVPFTRDERTVSFLPWAHVFGGDELHGIISLGASMAICDSIDRLAQDLADVRPTALFAVPRVWNQIYVGVKQHIGRRSSIAQAIFRQGLRAQADRKHGERLSLSEVLVLPL